MDSSEGTHQRLSWTKTCIFSAVILNFCWCAIFRNKLWKLPQVEGNLLQAELGMFFAVRWFYSPICKWTFVDFLSKFIKSLAREFSSGFFEIIRFSRFGVTVIKAWQLLDLIFLLYIHINKMLFLLTSFARYWKNCPFSFVWNIREFCFPPLVTYKISSFLRVPSHELIRDKYGTTRFEFIFLWLWLNFWSVYMQLKIVPKVVEFVNCSLCRKFT